MEILKNLRIVGPLYGWYTFSKGFLIRTPPLFWVTCGPGHESSSFLQVKILDLLSSFQKCNQNHCFERFQKMLNVKEIKR